MKEKVYWAIALLAGFGIIYVGWRYPYVLGAFHIVLCFILILVVLLQSGRAADLAGAFGGSGSQTAFGPRGAATFLSKATTYAAILFMITSLALAIKASRPMAGSVLEEGTPPAAPAGTAPTTPAPTAPGPAQPTPTQPPQSK
jgi:preprotein translocase subunit SecG